MKEESAIPSLTGETWRQVPTSPQYMASDLGRIFSLKTKRLLRPFHKSLTPWVQVSTVPQVQRRVDHLVAEAWLAPPATGQCLVHLNADLADCRVVNLAWMTGRQRMGRRTKGTGYGPPTEGNIRATLYCEWQSMRGRVAPGYGQRHLYYDRGVRCCQEWDSFDNFYQWALANGYELGKELDRWPDNYSGNYEPGNVRWTTHQENMDNRTTTVVYPASGSALTLTQWTADPRCQAKNYWTLRTRIKKGWTVHEALTTPVDPRNRQRRRADGV